MQGFALGGTRAPEQVSYDSVPITEPYLAITFDDGPSSMLTPQVLKILADRNAKATFFVTGENALSHPDIVKQELAAGHEIGTRSWAHEIFSRPTDDQLMADLQHADLAIKAAIGNSPRLFSPAEESFTSVQCDTVNKQLGYTVIYWTVDSLAEKSKGAAAVANTIITQAKPGAIIMSSDIDSTSVQALGYVLDTLAGKGYKFVTVSDLIAMQYAKKTSRPVRVVSNPGGATSGSPATAPPGTSAAPSASPSSVPAGSHPFGVPVPY